MLPALRPSRKRPAVNPALRHRLGGLLERGRVGALRGDPEALAVLSHLAASVLTGDDGRSACELAAWYDCEAEAGPDFNHCDAA
jgi:hypothetical protein